MVANYQLRRHLRSMELAGRPDAVAERELHWKACRLASDDREREYSKITPENFEAADAYQKRRLQFWKDRLKEDR